MIVVTIHLSGFLKLQGTPSGFTGGAVELPDNATVHEALAFIGVNEGMPWLVTHNGALADASARLHYGDTLVIIPPISGGIF